jgi:hypothetical protein
MLTNNFIFYSAKILGKTVWDIFYFPFWWYGQGLLRFFGVVKNFIKDRERSLAFLVWLKNIGVPMYGQYDWQGRIISFFMRLFQVIVRGLMMLFWLVCSLVILLIWIALPFFIFYEIYYQII